MNTLAIITNSWQYWFHVLHKLESVYTTSIYKGIGCKQDPCIKWYFSLVWDILRPWTWYEIKDGRSQCGIMIILTLIMIWVDNDFLLNMDRSNSLWQPAIPQLMAFMSKYAPFSYSNRQSYTSITIRRDTDIWSQQLSAWICHSFFYLLDCCF